MRKQSKNKFKMADTKPIQGHYGLEFALAHIDEDLSDVFKILESDKEAI